jgi:hypothetical protein
MIQFPLYSDKNDPNYDWLEMDSNGPLTEEEAKFISLSSIPERSSNIAFEVLVDFIAIILFIPAMLFLLILWVRQNLFSFRR